MAPQVTEWLVNKWFKFRFKIWCYGESSQTDLFLRSEQLRLQALADWAYMYSTPEIYQSLIILLLSCLIPTKAMDSGFPPLLEFLETCLNFAQLIDTSSNFENDTETRWISEKNCKNLNFWKNIFHIFCDLLLMGRDRGETSLNSWTISWNSSGKLYDFFSCDINWWKSSMVIKTMMTPLHTMLVSWG